MKTLSERMKSYEQVYNTRLTPRTPVIIRVDGVAFHTFTKKFDKPFDMVFREAMKNTMLRLCGNLQGAVFGYTQSDEISILLIDYSNLDSTPWYNYRTQKVCSIAASLATMYFNKEFSEMAYSDCYKANEGTAYFDARCFNIPESDVVNYFIHRQKDAIRNSISMVGQYYIPKEDLKGVSGKEIVDKLLSDYDVCWYSYEKEYRYGVSAKKKSATIETLNGVTTRRKWVLNTHIPDFSINKEYIKDTFKIKEEH